MDHNLFGRSSAQVGTLGTVTILLYAILAATAIAAKIEGEAQPPEEAATNVVDFMALLKQSLDAKKRTPAKKTAAKRTRAAKKAPSRFDAWATRTSDFESAFASLPSLRRRSKESGCLMKARHSPIAGSLRSASTAAQPTSCGFCREAYSRVDMQSCFLRPTTTGLPGSSLRAARD